MADFSKEATRRSAQVKGEAGEITLNFYEGGVSSGVGGGLPLVMLHGGEMKVESELDKGTTVTVALPIAYIPPAEQPSNVATLPPRPLKHDQSHQVKKSA